MQKQQKPINIGVRSKIKDYVQTWEQRCYSNGLPDEVPLEISDKAPSWKAIAICLLKNDLHLHGIGFNKPKSEYYNILKRKELLEKGKIKEYQTKLF